MMMISKFYLKQKILGSLGVNDLLWGVNWGPSMLWGYIWGKWGPPEMGGSLGTMPGP